MPENEKIAIKKRLSELEKEIVNTKSAFRNENCDQIPILNSEGCLDLQRIFENIQTIDIKNEVTFLRTERLENDIQKIRKWLEETA